jgi:hypothetical protein
MYSLRSHFRLISGCFFYPYVLHRMKANRNLVSAADKYYCKSPRFQDICDATVLSCSVAILGIGNVALDCARLLMSSTARLETTDIAERALVQLQNSSVEEVHVVARRGPAQVDILLLHSIVVYLLMVLLPLPLMVDTWMCVLHNF